MPELPEVQTIVDDLNKKVLNRTFIDVWTDWPSIVKRPQSFQQFRKKIIGFKIKKAKRRGKNILIYLTNGQRSTTNDYLLLVHQKLTGHLLYGKWRIKKASSVRYQVSSLLKGPLQEKVNDYIHLIFYLDNGWMLGLSDVRKFAKVLFGTKEEIENLPDLKNLGPEPLDEGFKVKKFKSLISSQKRKIKEGLMDQKIIAGIGNIYSDEILWQAKIHPFTPANELKSGQLQAIYSAMKRVLEKAIKLRGVSISDYRDINGKPGNYADSRFVYQREGEPCYRCKTPIKKVKIGGGRSAHYCPRCQK